MFNCDSCSFRSVRKDNYLAHVAEHKSESYSSNRRRKRNSPKPQVSSDLSVIVVAKIVFDAEWEVQNEQKKVVVLLPPRKFTCPLRYRHHCRHTTTECSRLKSIKLACLPVTCVRNEFHAN
jgi:hypothetical protein